jgi:hypothetical protein
MKPYYGRIFMYEDVETVPIAPSIAKFVSFVAVYAIARYTIHRTARRMEAISWQNQLDEIHNLPEPD